jgi:serine/threonine protein phosphatase 1
MASLGTCGALAEMPHMPSHLTFAIGDIHGELELVERAFAAIEARAARLPYRIITLGDYVDRGPDSAGVIRLLRHREVRGRLVCLKGNHEAMMVKACETGDAARWMRNGGDMTLRSYDDNVLQDDLDWMRQLPFAFEDKYRIYVHAGLKPSTALQDQEEETCIWIRDPFLAAPADALPTHIVHGHTPTWAGKPQWDEPECLPHRTNLDTGACYTGRLTIGVFDTYRAGGPIDMIRIQIPQLA